MTDPVEILPPELFEKIITYYFHDVGPVQFRDDVRNLSGVSARWMNKLNMFMSGYYIFDFDDRHSRREMMIRQRNYSGQYIIYDYYKAIFIEILCSRFAHLLMSDTNYITQFFNEYYWNPFTNDLVRYDMPSTYRTYEINIHDYARVPDNDLKRLLTYYCLKSNFSDRPNLLEQVEKMKETFMLDETDNVNAVCINIMDEAKNIKDYRTRVCICASHAIYRSMRKPMQHDSSAQTEFQSTNKWIISKDIGKLAAGVVGAVLGYFIYCYLFKN